MASSSHEAPGSATERTLIDIISRSQNEVTAATAESSFLERGMLPALRTLIASHEEEKYPTSHYTLHTKTVDIEGLPHKVMQVTYNNSPLSEEALKKMETESIKVRKFNLMAGVLYAMNFSPDFLRLQRDKSELFLMNCQRTIADIENSESTNPSSPGSQIEKFVNDFSEMLAGLTGQNKDEVIRAVRNAEQYFVADNNRQRVLAFETTMNDQPHWQIDIPFRNKLTEQQKSELLLIHQGENQPSWYKALSTWEQDWMKRVIPNSPDGDWKYFESLFQSSAMQHIPGIKNSRTNYLVKMNGDSPEILTRHMNASTMVPYEMPDDSRDRNTQLTAEQMLLRLEKNALENFNDLKKLFPSLPAGFKPTILAQSLLSDVALGGPDNLLTNIQKLAIDRTAGKDDHAYFQIISGNDPVNFLRMTTIQNNDRWSYAFELMQKAETLLKHLEKQPEIKVQGQAQDRFDLINQAYHNLHELTDVGFMERNASNARGVNFEAFKVAYLGILVEAMGGAVSTNCKSGKDRTGLEELYRNAMLIYFDQYKILPKFNDTPEQRNHFIQIFSTLFNSMKTQEAAASNTPGSFGLKDTAKMLCKDIENSLGNNYTASNSRSQMNKPSTFTKDEAAQSKTRNAVLSSISPPRSPWSRRSPMRSSSQSSPPRPSSSSASPLAERSGSSPLATPELKGLYAVNFRIKGNAVDVLLDPAFNKELSKTILHRLNQCKVSSQDEHDQQFIRAASEVLSILTGKGIKQLYVDPTFDKLKNDPYFHKIFELAITVQGRNEQQLSMRSNVSSRDELRSMLNGLLDNQSFTDTLLNSGFQRALSKTINHELSKIQITSAAEHDQKYIETANQILKEVAYYDIGELKANYGFALRDNSFFKTLFNIADQVAKPAAPGMHH